MGTIMDVMKWNHDYVDNPFWSVMQIRVKYLDDDKAKLIGEVDPAKVNINTIIIIIK